jgi:uncharacterized protein (DUF983 family)
LTRAPFAATLLGMEQIYTNDPAAPSNDRKAVEAVLRGLSCRCPACGTGPIYNGYLKVAESCAACGEELHHQRADDAPPYFTMFIVAHIVVGGILMLEQSYAPETWIHLVIWLPMTLILSLWLLPRVKGGLIGLQWALRMHGFGGADEAAEPPPAA